MKLETINKNIERLLKWRANTDENDYKQYEKITLQLAKLYDFKNEILLKESKNEANV